MSDDQKLFPWDEGQPTKPDVDALLAAWPPETIKPGEWKVTDAEIRAIIAFANGTRFRTVYTRWVNRLARDHSINVYRSKSTGFYCPTAAEVYSRTHPTLEGAGRKIGKQLHGVSISKPSTPIEAATKDHHGKLLYVQKRELKKARMNVLPDLSAPVTPSLFPRDESLGGAR